MLQRRESLKKNVLGHNEVAASDLPISLLSPSDEGADVRKAVGLPAAPLGAYDPIATPTPPPPPEALPPPVSRKTSSSATLSERNAEVNVGLVHARLAEFNLSGKLPLLDGDADVASAAYHLVCAASANEPRALRDLRSLCRGLSADELLPGVRIADEDLEGLSSLVPSLTARLAYSGDATAMLELANTIAASSVDGAAEAAAAWVQAAIGAVERAPASLQTELRLGGCAAYLLLQRLAEL